MVTERRWKKESRLHDDLLLLLLLSAAAGSPYYHFRLPEHPPIRPTWIR